MLDSEQNLQSDINKIQQIPIVHTLLEVICRTTGMGFAAIARVTNQRWIACGVRDEINFGLKSGDELQIETTICNEVQQARQLVVIDHVSEDQSYRNHHTPAMYGFQSYISVPITRQNGDFFGTLCAIDPKPAQLNNPKILGMFKLFAELIAFHLASVDMMEETSIAVKELNKQLVQSVDENRQYQYISNHNLQEPLRKLRLFSDMLVDSIDRNEFKQAKEFAHKINFSAQRFSMMIQDLSTFKNLGQQDALYETIDLNQLIVDVCTHLKTSLDAKQAVVQVDRFPQIIGIREQIEQLFFHLISNAAKFAKDGRPLKLQITHVGPEQQAEDFRGSGLQLPEFVDIRISDNGVGIDKYYLEKIFDLFAQGNFDASKEGKGIGLAYCRKIVRNHGGIITAQSNGDTGTTFSILLPLKKSTPE